MKAPIPPICLTLKLTGAPLLRVLLERQVRPWRQNRVPQTDDQRNPWKSIE